MTAEYLIVAADPDAYRTDPPIHLSVVNVGVIDSGIVINVLTNATVTVLPGDTLIGVWDYTGKSVEDIDHELYSQIRPLGNNEDGTATLNLRAHHFAGWMPRELGDHNSPDPVLRLYQADEAPFAIIVDHVYYEQAEFSGWGFLAEIAGGADSRDPSARAMGVYSDPECTAYLWTGGAYQLGPSRLGQVDENGDPLQVWFSDTPAGFRTSEPEEWHLACLLGSAQEGHATLPVGQRIELLFWEHNQGQGGEVPDWVQPTGAHDSYQLGDHVIHNGVEWVSVHDGANSWEPGVYGWSEA